METKEEILKALNASTSGRDRFFAWETLDVSLEEEHAEVLGTWRHGSEHLIVITDKDHNFYGLTYKVQPNEGIVKAGYWEEYIVEVAGGDPKVGLVVTHKWKEHP